MKKNNIIKIFITMLILTLTLNLSFANTTPGAVSLKLLNQNPDPVKAGEIVTVRISVENLGGTSVEGYSVRFEDNYPFTLFESEQREYNLGKILANAGGTSAQILKFKARVSEDVSEGNYPIKIIGISNNGVQNIKEFLVEVNSEANAEISSISVDSLIPGEKTLINFGIKNVGKSDLENIKFSWQSQDDIILPVGSGNFKYIDRIKKGEEEILSFQVVSDLNTEPKLYKLELTVEYDDVESLQTITDAGTIENQKRREVVSKAGIYVGGKTDFEISQKDSTINSVTFSIANIGSNLASSVVIKVPEQDNYETISSDSKVIGNIKKGAFGRFEFDLNQLNKQNQLNLVIEYTDTTGKRQSAMKTVKVNLQDKALFSDEPKSESSNTKTYMITALLIIGIGIYLYRNKRQKKYKHN